MKIYVAGPLSADIKEKRDYNIAEARNAGIEILRKGHVPFVPHTISEGWHDDSSLLHLKDFYYLDAKWLSLCDAILMLPGWKESTGSMWEHAFAKVLNLEILYDINEVDNDNTRD